MSAKGPNIPQNQYMFPQQRDASCFLMPFYHLAIMQEQQKKDGTIRHFDREWHTKLEWLVKTFPGIRDWHVAMGQLSSPQNRQSAFGQLQADLIENGFLQENVTEYQLRSGVPYIAGESIEDMMKMHLTPFNTSVKDKGGMLTKTLPIYYDKGAFYCYDPEQSEFIRLSTSAKLDKDGLVSINKLNIPARLKDYYKLDGQMYLLNSGKGFGKHAMLKACYIDKNYEILNDKETGYFYGEGLYQLMLFAMGVDNQNNTIQPGHELYTAYQEFRAEMGKSPDNPWNSAHFKKENLLEYHIAEIIKQNPSIRQALKETLADMTAWPYYQMLDDLGLKGKKDAYLPGEEQMLAYAVAQNLKHLWAASLSKEKFITYLDLDELTPEAIEELGVDNIIDGLKEQATEPCNSNGQSFLDCWDTIRQQVQQRVGQQNCSLVSFDGHGSVKAFGPAASKYQAAKGLADPTIFSRLGYTEIDSYYQEGRQPFYQRTPEEQQEMEQAAIKIQSLWRGYKAREALKKIPSQKPPEQNATTKATSSAQATTSSTQPSGRSDHIFQQQLAQAISRRKAVDDTKTKSKPSNAEIRKPAQPPASSTSRTLVSRAVASASTPTLDKENSADIQKLKDALAEFGKQEFTSGQKGVLASVISRWNDRTNGLTLLPQEQSMLLYGATQTPDPAYVRALENIMEICAKYDKDIKMDAFIKPLVEEAITSINKKSTRSLTGRR